MATAGNGNQDAKLAAVYAIAAAMREARALGDAAPAIAREIARACGSSWCAIRAAGSPLAALRDPRRGASRGPRPGAIVALPLIAARGTVGVVELEAAAARGAEGLGALLSHVASEIEALERRRATTRSLHLRAERDRAELLDRAERERARMYQLFDRVPALIAIQRGPEHELTFTNSAMQRLLGASKGGPLRAALPFEHYVALVDEVFRSGERAIGTEIAVRRDWNDGGAPTHRWFNVVHEPIWDGRGTVEGVMSFAFDVSDLVVARRRAEAAVRKLEATSRAKDDFLATVSHELRTPLGSILGWASLLLDRFDDAAVVAKGAEVIHRSAKAQARIIDDILDVSRIITGKLRIEARPVDIEAVVRSALEVVRPSAAAKSIEIDVALPDEPCSVVGDEERLRQVAWNLLSNAIKFTDRGGRVTVRLARGAGSVVIEVADTGKGIAPEFLPHVFERFRQADSSTTRAQSGLGLGLAIVRHIVELHGGHVEARSEGAGSGTVFTVSLPIRAVATRPDALPPARPAETPAPPVTPPSSLDALEGLRVLVVDDELDAREMLGLALSIWGVRVRTAESARDAMLAMSEEMPDLVISDVGMPGEDGYAFVRKLKALRDARGEQVTAVALTAYARRDDAARALAAGFDFHVAKPIELEDLRVVVERAVRRAAPA